MRVKFAGNGTFPISSPEQIRLSWSMLHSHWNDHMPAEKKKEIADKIAEAWREQIDPKGPPKRRSNATTDQTG